MFMISSESTAKSSRHLLVGMAMILISMLLAVCFFQTGSYANQTLAIFSKIASRPPSPRPVQDPGSTPFNWLLTPVLPRSGDSTPPSGDSGMDPEQYQT